MTNDDEMREVARLWECLPGPAGGPPALTFSGTAALPSIFEVGAAATVSIALATLAVADLQARRSGTELRPVHVDRTHAAAAFRSERYLSAVGWELPPLWDPIAGDYATRDGFVRLHTNYPHHRAAALRVLDPGTTGRPSRESVARSVASWDATSLEEAIVAEGGCAAAMRTAAAFDEHPQGRAIASEPLFDVHAAGAGSARFVEAEGAARTPSAPLLGIRVLDLTRVIAGPVCTRFLAAHGADVLRVDPPGFEEGVAALCDTTAGKRRAALDLRTAAGRTAFERLLAGADVFVHGLRPDALDRLGLGEARRRALNPSLITVTHDAHGWTGPWAKRRGFDSLVQMSTGIAAAGARASGTERPVPLPAQALDHGTGYLAAAAVCRALSHLLVRAEVTTTRLSLARTARWLGELGTGGDPGAPELTAESAAPYLEEAPSAWGLIRRIRCPGRIEGAPAGWRIAPGPTGVDAAGW